MDEKIVGLVIVALIYVVLMAIIGPFLTIWSLNTLFGFTLAYSFKNWMAIVWLTIVLHGIQVTSKANSNTN